MDKEKTESNTVLSAAVSCTTGGLCAGILICIEIFIITYLLSYFTHSLFGIWQFFEIIVKIPIMTTGWGAFIGLILGGLISNRGVVWNRRARWALLHTLPLLVLYALSLVFSDHSDDYYVFWSMVLQLLVIATIGAGGLIGFLMFNRLIGEIKERVHKDVVQGVSKKALASVVIPVFTACIIIISQLGEIGLLFIFMTWYVAPVAFILGIVLSLVSIKKDGANGYSLAGCIISMFLLCLYVYSTMHMGM